METASAYSFCFAVGALEQPASRAASAKAAAAAATAPRVLVMSVIFRGSPRQRASYGGVVMLRSIIRAHVARIAGESSQYGLSPRRGLNAGLAPAPATCQGKEVQGDGVPN